MKTTILIKENRTQLVLHPEGTHDKAVLDILAELPNTHRTDLYDRQGGYTMFDKPNFMSGGKTAGKDLMIVFDEATDLASENPASKQASQQEEG